MTPLISIIIPLYNKALYVKRTLNSVSAQTFKDYEVIIIDDGSTDNSYEIVTEWINQNIVNASDHQWITVSRTNKGVAKTRNEGVEMAKAPYICFLDADDWWNENYLQIVYSTAMRYPHVLVFGCNYLYYKIGKKRVGATHLLKKDGALFEKDEIAELDYPTSYLKGTGMPFNTCSMMINRQVFISLGGFQPVLKIGEDFLFIATMCMHYSVIYINTPLSIYNNDVPNNMRATGIIHHPNNNFLFHLDSLQNELLKIHPSNAITWTQLFDKLRIEGLVKYYVHREYHPLAQAELNKVVWTDQNIISRCIYACPASLLKTLLALRQQGSRFKQYLRNLVRTKV